MTTPIHCTNCSRPYPAESLPYRCPYCGGIYDYTAPPAFDPPQVDPTLPGIWRYRHTFDLPIDAPLISLGEGNTPLIWSQVTGQEVAFKLEFLNPTGSFKDRGTAPLISFLLQRGVTAAVEDSSGNAGASFAAYAAAAGLQARIFVPDYASGPKRAQIAAYGAEIVRILGPRSNAAEAVTRAAGQGAVYASHAYMPHDGRGYATIAYELVEQLGRCPGTVVAPVGQGSLLLGITRGFQALKAAGVIECLPLLVGVQAARCAPLWALFTNGPVGLRLVSEGDTIAEGVRIRYPLRGDALLQMVLESNGFFVAVDEGAILPGRDQLARRGLFVEPTSAIVWNALEQILSDPLSDPNTGPVVAILTGSGLKSAS
ncbi:MAG: pyridoxal-phosphate dependent enzyme [Anaerolineales bacterium]|nr:pyridoxal-phosphate dependent enzyme [Anaerolineales bacterium]